MKGTSTLIWQSMGDLVNPSKPIIVRIHDLRSDEVRYHIMHFEEYVSPGGGHTGRWVSQTGDLDLGMFDELVWSHLPT
jgi:hypothetical protein